MALETPSRPPPPFMANAILNFHFDFLNPSLKLMAKFVPTHLYPKDYSGPVASVLHFA